MRLFIAIDIPDKIKKDLAKLIDPLKKRFPQVVWTKDENIHLTVKFLGYVKTDNNNLLSKITEYILAVTQNTQTFNLEFEKVGYFEGEQLIVWVGLRSNKELLSLVKKLDVKLKDLGFRAEKRIYTPHITVGRGKRLFPSDSHLLKDTIKKQQFNIPIFFRATKISLVESKLTPEGPIYTSLFRFALT